MALPRRRRARNRTQIRRWPRFNALRFQRLEDRCVLAVFTVNTTADSVDANPGDGLALDANGQTSLRAAVMEANALAGADFINLPAGTYDLSIAGPRNASAASGDLDLTGPTTIQGAGADTTIIDAHGLGDRVFDVPQGASTSNPLSVSLDGLTVTGGTALDPSLSNLLEQDGGGMRIGFYTDVSIAHCVFRDNQAPTAGSNQIFGSGGAISGSGVLDIQASRFEENFASNSGGALYLSGNIGTSEANRNLIRATIADTTFDGNHSVRGGAITSHIPLTVARSTFSNNVARYSSGSGQGGAIEVQASIFSSLTLTNSTLAGNQSVFGGAIYNVNSIAIQSSTIAGNQADYAGGGIYGGGANATIENSIVAANSASQLDHDFAGSFVSRGHNLIGDSIVGSTDDITWSPAVGDLLDVAPALGALADNGGPTRTMALLLGSPAINAANTATAPATDQRGVPRPIGGAADIGAFESAVSTNAAPVAADDNATTDEDTPAFIDVLANDSDADGDSLTFTLVSTPTHGTATINPAGTVSYMPDANFNGVDSFTYKANDGSLDSNVARVSITVNPVNDPPVAVDDSATTDEDAPIAIAVLANDSDVDGDSLTVSAVGAPAHGTASINVDGTVSYSPAANFNGADSFTYTISDGQGGTATASVSVTVNTVNAPPTITRLDSNHEDPQSASEDGTLAISGAYSDPGDLDTHLVVVDWGDGSAVEGLTSVDQINDQFDGSHHYSSAGIYTISVTVIDSQGQASAVKTTTAAVAGVGVVGDVLYIIGTQQDDHVSINELGHERLKVHASFLPHGNSLLLDSSSIDMIVAYLGAGDDDLSIAGDVDIPAIVDGGAGDDHLSAGGGRAILVGGSGHDRLVGGRADDVLIGGSVEDEAALQAALGAWASDDDYDIRSAAIKALLTIVDDNAEDRLTGGAGRELVFDSF